MDLNQMPENAKKTSLENLTRDELLTKCKTLLSIAQKAKQAKDSLQEEYNHLKERAGNNDAATAIIEKFTQEKLEHVTTIEELKKQNSVLNNKLQNSLEELCKCEVRSNELDTENVSLKRQVKRLGEENEQLLHQLETLEKETDECKRLGLEQQKQLLALENLEINLASKDKSILVLRDELEVKNKEIEALKASTLTPDDNLETTVLKLKEKLKSYHSKIVKFAGTVRVLKESKNEILSMFKNHTQQVEEWKSQLSSTSHQLIAYLSKLEDENKILKEANKQLEAHKTDDEKGKKIENIQRLRIENKRLGDEIKILTTMQDEYKSQIEALFLEKENIHKELSNALSQHQKQLQVCNDQNKKDFQEIQIRKEEDEKICIEYRKVISKLEETIELNNRQLENLKVENQTLLENIEHYKSTEKELSQKTGEEIIKLVQENSELTKQLKELEEITKKDAENQTDVSSDNPGNQAEDLVGNLKRENADLLREMNEMNQALKERGETISNLQAHFEEVRKKLQVYESQANKKEELVKKLQDEIDNNAPNNDLLALKDQQIQNLQGEIDALKSSAVESNYAESETMSTSTVPRGDEAGSRLRDLEGSWEERYGKLRNLALKLKAKIKDLTNELGREHGEKNEVINKLATATKTITTVQFQCDQFQDELEANKTLARKYLTQIGDLNTDISAGTQRIAQKDEELTKLKAELDEMKEEKIKTEQWKKQIGAKVQVLRKEVEAGKILKEDYEKRIEKLKSELEGKQKELETESNRHKQTKSSLEHSNNEVKKNSVLNLEMQDYERSVKDLAHKLDQRQEEADKLKAQVESQKSTVTAVREQNRLLEERRKELEDDVDTLKSELQAYRKQISDLETLVSQKDDKIHSLTSQLETVRTENEELATELSKIVTEHQKSQKLLKDERDYLKSQTFGLQQSLREAQEAFKLKVEELKSVSGDYENYKVRAQSVLRQNNNRDVGVEERLAEEVMNLKSTTQRLEANHAEATEAIRKLKEENDVLVKAKTEVSGRLEETLGELEDLKTVYEQLSQKHQQTVIEHGETVRSLKVHAETLAQCYRQQLSEQEVRHNREIIELQSKIEKAPSPTDMPLLPFSTMHREEGEGSESTEPAPNIKKLSIQHLQPVPLERLLLDGDGEDVAFFKKQLAEEESKVAHLTALLADTEQDLAKHAQMNQLLKEEIRRQQRSLEREKHAENLEYLKNVVFKFLTLTSGDERSRLVPVMNTILKLSPEETQKLNGVARGEPGIKAWSNYLPVWGTSPSSKQPQ